MTDLSNFRPIPGYEDYLVSENGDVFSKKTNKLLSPSKIGHGYLKVVLHRNKKYKNFLIHRLVAQAFLNNPDNLPQINHIDGDKLNNNVDNLEFCTAAYNNQHAWKLGLKENTRQNIKRAQEANIKHLDDNLQNLFDDIFIFKLKNKDICQKYNLKSSYVSRIKNKRRLKTALNEYFGGSNNE